MASEDPRPKAGNTVRRSTQRKVTQPVSALKDRRDMATSAIRGGEKAGGG